MEFKILGKGYLSDTYSGITPLNGEKAEITDFGVSKTRGTVEVLINPYYENGQLYIYYLKENDEEIATSGNCSEGMLYKTMYANNTIVNEFNIDTNTRTINVTKKWDMTNVPEDEKKALQYPEVKIKLYRYIGVDADKSTSNKPESTSSMDLVETKIIKPDEIKKNTNGESTIAFTDLLIYSPRGDRFHYYVEEEKINGYSVDYSGDEITEANSNGIYITDKKTIQDTAGEGNSTDSPNFGIGGGWSSVIENNKVPAESGPEPIIGVPDTNDELDSPTSTNGTTNENNNKINVTNVTVTNTSNVITKELNVSNVVANTKGNTWRYVFTGLTKNIKVDTDGDGITTWKKKFDTLPVARVGAEGEESSVAIHYRAVLCTVQDSYYMHPQYVNVVKNDTSYSINPTKTYHNYDDVSEYDTTAWSYSDDSKTYNMNLDLRMITNEYANRDGKNLIKYKIVQSVVPPRYFITQEADIPTFDDAIDEYNYEMGNTLNLLVKLKKYDQINGKAHKGTQFELYKYNEGTSAYDRIKNLTADASGNISMEFKDFGVYQLIETKAVKGYEDKLDYDGEPDPVDGSRFECYFIVENKNLRQTVIINNTNTKNMSRYASNTLGSGDNSSGFSTASVPTLEPAEPVVPLFAVSAGWGSLITSTGLVNLRKLGELSFSKQDVDTKAKLDGVTFELYKYANENGTGALNYLCEIESGYDYTFVVNDSTVNDTTGRNENIYIQHNGKVVANNIITNSKTKFTFKKLGLNDKLLTGGTFKIVSNDGNDVQQSFWNKASDDISLKVNILKSNNVVYGLPVGNYRIIETDVPYGYKVASDLAFSIDKYGNARNISNTKFSNNIVNFRDESIDVKVVNVDEDFATPINGSRFELTGKFAMNYGSDISGEQTIDRTVSGEKWLIQELILPSEPSGTQYIYKLYQTNVPAGYEERNLPVYFTMDENYKISLTDENGNVPSAELQEEYDLFVKIDNTSVPTITFENLRIPRNDIYVDNGDNYTDPLGNVLCKVFYAYDNFAGEDALPVPKMCFSPILLYIKIDREY